MVKLPLKLYCDGKTAISIIHNSVQHEQTKQTKHIETDCHFIKDKIDSGTLRLPFVLSYQHTTDILTKSLTRTTFEYLISKLDMIDIYAPISKGC